MRARRWTCGLTAALLAGCGGAPPLQTADEFVRPTAPVEAACDREAPGRAVAPFVQAKHVLVSDSEGNLPDERHGGSFSAAFRTIMGGYAEAVARSPDPARPPRLLFYFNGGLNSQAAVEAQARRQVPCMLADGLYPVFFVWDTAGASSYLQQVSSIWDGQFDRSLATRARTPFMVLGNVASGLGAAPVDYFTHGRRFWRALRREPFCSMVVRDNDGPANCALEQQVTFVDEVGGTVSRDTNVVAAVDVDAGQREVGRFVSYSALLPVRAVSTPLAHGIGDAAWENMLRRTRTTIRQPLEFDLDRHADWNGDGEIDGWNKCPNDFIEKRRDFPKGTGVFGRFFETIVRYRKPDGRGMPVSTWRCTAAGEVKEEPPTPEQAAADARTDQAIAEALERAGITLIGHSMGAIVINELVDRFENLPYSEIVVMASAASLRETRRVMDAYFESDTGGARDTRFHALMLHPLNDARERQFAGAVPAGSLLMWIDEMYDPPKTPEDKVFGYWPTAKAARQMFGSAAQDRTLYRVFSRPQAPKDAPSNPIEHGQFNEDDMCFWRPSFWGVVGTSWEPRYRAAFLPRTFARCGERHEEPQSM